MNRDKELQLLDRIRELAAARSSDADEGITKIDVDCYRSVERFDEEHPAFFRRSWVALAHASEVAGSGDYATLTAAGVPVLVVRDKEGKVRAFRNVCRHRGSRVAEGRGCEKSFTCPYHGWTYGLDGALLGVPHEWGFEGLDKARSALVPIETQVRCGVVFGRLEGDAEFDHPALEEIRHFVPDDAAAFCRRDKTVHANWKIIVDGALEAYHIKRTHADSIYPMFIDNVGVAERLGRDLRVVMPKRSIRELSESDRDRWKLREHANIVYYLFPNILLLVLGDHAMLVWAEPEAVDRTRVHSMMLVPRLDGREKYWLANEALFQNTLDEDYAVGESIQSGLCSGANDHITLGKFEKGIRLFHAILDEA